MVVLLGVVAAMVIGLGSWIPVSHSGEVITTGPGGYVVTPEVIPDGENVTVRWAVSFGSPVTFYILRFGTDGGPPAADCGSTGVSGSCSFPSEGEEFAFGAWGTYSPTIQTVNFTWSYLAPIL